MRQDNWKCPKCHNKDYKVGQFAATGGGILKRPEHPEQKF